jgi:hypothetical protein
MPDIPSSITDFYLLEIKHGKIIGVIHQVQPDGVQSGFLFFKDGHAHEYFNMSLKKGTNSSRESLRIVVTSIPGGYLYSDAIEILGTAQDETSKKSFKNGMSVFYCFSPIGIISNLFFNCHGFEIYSTFKEKIYTQNLGECIDLEEAIQ